MDQATGLRIAGFWPRFAASLIDGVLLTPLTMPTSFIIGYGPAWVAIAWLVVTAPALWLYTIVCHGRWGKTLGKHIMEMRLARAEDGGQIGFRHAIRRDLPMLAFGFIGTALLVSVVASGETESFRHNFFAEQRDYDEDVSIGQIFRDSYSDAYGPPELLIVALLQMTWFWAEAITMLSNRRRRAIHDYLGGTIVVSTSTPRTAPALPPMEIPRQSHPTS